MNEARGFTLLEVLIALAIVAISAAALMRQAAHVSTQAARLEQKTLAFQVADNAMATLLSASRPPAQGRSSNAVDFYGNEWMLRTRVTPTAEAGLQRIEIEVASAGTPDAVLAELVSFRGRR